MAVIINGTSGITDVDGSAAAPAITGTDTDTGLFFSANTLGMAVNGAAGATLTTTGLGIGTGSPSYNLDVAQNADSASNGIRLLNSNAGTSAAAVLRFGTDQGNIGFVRANSSTNTAAIGGASAVVVGNGTANPVVISTNGVARATFDSSGNLGLGVTPSGWGSSKAIQFGSAASIFAVGANSYMATNEYYDGTNNRYIGNGYATLYSQQSDGAHKWYTAPSGTAGNTISFTQAMTLDASGNLLVGLTSSDAKFHVTNGASPSSRLIVGGGGGAASTLYTVLSGGNNIQFETGGIERARITSAGEFIGYYGIRSTSYVYASGTGGTQGYYLGAGSDNGRIAQASGGIATTTTYIGNQTITTSSDVRLKANIKPTERNALELLNQWEIIDHTWNDPSDQCENNRNSRGVWTGVKAQQVQTITPWLVNKPLQDTNEDGSINPWVMDFGYSVPLLVKAIQELKAELDTAKARIAALESK